MTGTVQNPLNLIQIDRHLRKAVEWLKCCDSCNKDKDLSLTANNVNNCIDMFCTMLLRNNLGHCASSGPIGYNG